MRQQSSSVPSRELAERAIRHFESNRHAYGRLDVRTAYMRIKDSWRVVAWALRAVLPETDVPVGDLKYDSLHLVTEEMELDAFEELMTNAWERGVWQSQKIWDPTKTHGDLRIQSIRNAFCDRSGRLFFARIDTQPGSNSGPLLRFELPYYSDASVAVDNWMGIANGLGCMADGNAGGAVFLPETRAWFDTLRVDGRELSIRVGQDSRLGCRLRVRGELGPIDAEMAVEADIVSGAAMIPVPPKTDSFELILLDEYDGVLAWHRETPHFVNSQRAVLFARVEAIAAEERVRQIQSGEGDRVEFKTFIAPSDKKKFPDIPKTICSFANTHGGTLLIGVEDDSRVSGIDAGASKWSKEPPETATDKYLNEIRRRVASELAPLPEIGYSIETVDGVRVLVAAVQQGASPPTTFNGAVLVRRGATTRAALGPEVRALCELSSRSRRRGPWS